MAQKSPRILVYSGVCVFAFLLIAYLFLFRPNQQLNDAKASLTSKEFIELKSDIRVGFAQALGGSALLIGLAFAWRNIRAVEKNLVISQENIRATQDTATKNIAIALEGQITERFTRAIELIGNDKLEVRIGGIYALERISKDSEKDYWSIIEVLTAFVREKARWTGDDQSHPLPQSQKAQADIQAALNVIKRRRLSYKNGEEDGIDLSGTDLRNIDLVKANLNGAHLVRAHLEGALLMRIQLDDANLSYAHLDGAALTAVGFTDTTRLKDTTFVGALVRKKDLEGVVCLTQAQIESMYFIDMNILLETIKDNEPMKRKLERVIAEVNQR